MAHTKISATANSTKVEVGDADVLMFTQKDRARKVMETLGLFWGLAIASVFIPVFHFVLVPLFLLLGIVMAIRARKYEAKVLSGEIACPHCGSKLVLKPVSVIWPLREICQNCASQIKISIS